MIEGSWIVWSGDMIFRTEGFLEEGRQDSLEMVLRNKEDMCFMSGPRA